MECGRGSAGQDPGRSSVATAFPMPFDTRQRHPRFHLEAFRCKPSLVAVSWLTTSSACALRFSLITERLGRSARGQSRAAWATGQ